MDFLKDQATKFASGENNNNNNNNGGGNFGSSNNNNNEQSNSGNSSGGGSGGFLSGITNKLNSAAGGGVDSEKDEDYLDKAVDYAQEKFMNQGPQNNESAVEQAKDEQISDYIRGQYKSYTGSDVPIQDKPTRMDRNAD